MSINIDETRYSVPEFALKAKLGKTTAWKCVNQGMVGSLKLGKKIWVPESALIDFLNRSYRPAVNEIDSAILKASRRKNRQAQAG